MLSLSFQVPELQGRAGQWQTDCHMDVPSLSKQRGTSAVPCPSRVTCATHGEPAHLNVPVWNPETRDEHPPAAPLCCECFVVAQSSASSNTFSLLEGEGCCAQHPCGGKEYQGVLQAVPQQSWKPKGMQTGWPHVWFTFSSLSTQEPRADEVQQFIWQKPSAEKHRRSPNEQREDE